MFAKRSFKSIDTKIRDRGARRNAYANRLLSIGHGHTISQSYNVPLMTYLLT